MKEKNGNSMKVSKFWKKALYSSVVLGAIFVGGQYLSSVQVKADTTATQDNDQSNYTQIRFTDASNGYEVVDARSHNDSINGFEVDTTVGQKTSLVNAKTILKDMGYDVSNISDTYTPTKQQKELYPVPIQHVSVENKPSNLSGPNNLIFEIRDQNGNYIESKYDSTDGNYTLDYNYPIYNSTGKKIVDALSQETDKFVANKYTIAEANIDTTPLHESSGDNIVTIPVVAPTHTLTLNYVNQNGVTVLKTTRQVTNFGHTDFYDDYVQDIFGNNADYVQINPDQPVVSNNQSTATVNVTTNPGFQMPTDPSQVPTYDHGYTFPSIASDTNINFLSPDLYAYHTTLNFIGADGKQITSIIVGSNSSQNVDPSQLIGEDTNDGSYINFADVTDFPSFIDLTKGPYTFHSNDTLSALQASAAAQSQAAAAQQSASASQDSQSSQASSSTATQPSAQPANSNSQQAPAPQPAQFTQSHAAAPASTAQPAQPVAKAKPTKAQLKAATKSINTSKRAIKTDTAKLKALKKKMKKHATKQQKSAYKAIQKKLAADKKAVKSYKAQEAKLTKYFKEVSIINRDNKQIKSLTAQMKKLKKKHSKASKKQYAKAAKALKKANSSLKAATKFVNNFK
ncbi:hypothetical protein [Apilactobacillus zhangqiuensis]|uniref:hypothetical protein n=1 Tax=Apilactobacillus zhangqiuensis TaxID=2841031 RepID=UPI001C7D2DCA|nr:hypothetical protein [Apilactobacillus zhangqiuensis]